jgi:hypothetical protein
MPEAAIRLKATYGRLIVSNSSPQSRYTDFQILIFVPDWVLTPAPLV